MAELSKSRETKFWNLAPCFFFYFRKYFNDIELKELVAAEKFPSHIFNSLIGTRCGRLRQSHTQSQFQGRSQVQKLELELNPFLFFPNPPYFRVRIKSPLLGVTKCAFQLSPLSLSLILLFWLFLFLVASFRRTWRWGVWPFVDFIKM